MLYTIALTLVEKVGPRTMCALLDGFGSARAVFEAPQDVLQSARLQPASVHSILSGNALARARGVIEHCERIGVRILTRSDPDFPRQLAECSDAPHLLYVRGAMTDFNRGQWISVVGTRNATPAGIESTTRMVRELAMNYPDAVVVSGLAFGIDKAAHVAALRFGIRTVAVMAGWVDDIVPRSHFYLARQIFDAGGAIVSDMPPGTVIERGNFLSRNRIVAGLSPLTVVVESAARGGSLITADLADSYGKVTVAMPGRPGDPSTEGTNMLIASNKAEIYRSVEQLADLAHWQRRAAEPQHVESALTRAHPLLQAMYSALPDGEHLSVDQIADLFAIPIHEASSRLLKLKSLRLVEIDSYRQYYKRRAE